MSNTKSAFVTIPIVSSFLIVGIVVCLQWAPFHKRTLKKPGTNKNLLTFKLSTMMMIIWSYFDIGDECWCQLVDITILSPFCDPQICLQHDVSNTTLSLNEGLIESRI